MRRRRFKISNLILIILLVAALTIGGIFLYQTLNQKREEVPQEAPTSQDKEKEPTKSEPSENSAPVKEKVIQYEGDDPNTAAELSGVITYAVASGSNLMVRVNINQLLGSGTCKLSLSSGGTTIYSDTAPIVGSASTSTCEGFNVPLSALSSGKYQIIIDLTSGDKSGQITGETTI